MTTFEGAAPRGVGLTLAFAGLAVAGLAAGRRIELPPGLPPVVPRIEAIHDLDQALRRLTGRPVLLLCWNDDRGAWLPDVDRLYRTYGAQRLEVIGIPRIADETRLAEILRRHRIKWRQLLGAGTRKSSIRLTWPGVVLVAAHGAIVYSGAPGKEVERHLGLLLGPVVEAAGDIRGGVEGRLLFAGRPLHEITGGAARFWFRDEWSGQVASLRAEHDPSSSGFRWVGAPGTYLADVSVGPRHDRPPHLSYNGFATFTMGAGEPQVLEVSLQRILHLRQPVDNARTLPPHWREPVHASPVRFAWDALAEASLYRYTLNTLEGSRWVVKEPHQTNRPEVEIALPPGRYQFSLSAHGPAGLVGRLEVYGQDYRAGFYAFSVR